MNKDEEAWGRTGKKITPKSAKDFKPGKASCTPAMHTAVPIRVPAITSS